MTRILNDAYQTPPECVSKLLSHIDMTDINRFLEPCRGKGNIYRQVKARRKVYCEIDGQRDYLKTHFRKRFDVIITNPPFQLWRPFLEKSLKEADLVIYLLRLNCLGSGKKTHRGRFWNGHQPTHLFPLESRPSFTGAGTDMTDYAWFIWDSKRFPRVNSPWLKVI
jgi:hypothetical protein